jgi:hypothetical protein
MSNETRDRAREVLAQTAFDGIAQAAGADLVWLGHGCDPEAVTDCYAIADRGIAALDAADIRLAGEGEVVMDAGRANWLLQVAALASIYAGKVNDDLQCWVEHWGDGRCEETKEPQQQAYNDLVQALDKRRPGDLDPIGGSDGNHPREL